MLKPPGIVNTGIIRLYPMVVRQRAEATPRVSFRYVSSELHFARLSLPRCADSRTRSCKSIGGESGVLWRSRPFYGDPLEYGLTSLLFTQSTLDVFPSGISSAPVTISLANGDYAKTITASTAGFIRVSH